MRLPSTAHCRRPRPAVRLRRCWARSPTRWPGRCCCCRPTAACCTPTPQRAALRLGRPLRLSAQRRVEPAPAPLRAEFAAALADAVTGRQRVLQWPADGPLCCASITALAADSSGCVPVLVALSAADTRAAAARAYAALHGLSSAETCLLERLALGESPRSAAAVLGVTAATVRSRIVALRRKTGHASMGALLQTLAALPPLAAEDAGAGDEGQRR